MRVCVCVCARAQDIASRFAVSSYVKRPKGFFKLLNRCRFRFRLHLWNLWEYICITDIIWSFLSAISINGILSCTLFFFSFSATMVFWSSHGTEVGLLPWWWSASSRAMRCNLPSISCLIHSILMSKRPAFIAECLLTRRSRGAVCVVFVCACVLFPLPFYLNMFVLSICTPRYGTI